MSLWSPVVCKGIEVGLMSAKSQVVGPCPELGRLVRQLTGDVPSRVASRRAGISHDTIIRMWAGDKVSEGMILRFAQGYRTDPNPLLEAAGYPPLPTRQAPTPKTQDELQGDSAGEIERVRDPEAGGPEEDGRMKWIAAYDNLPFKIRESMRAQMEAILEEAYQKRGDIVGKRQK